MSLALNSSKRLAHPVDLIEQVAGLHNWSFERTAQDEIAVCVKGNLALYSVAFSWMEQREALHIACSFELSVSHNRTDELLRLLVEINSQLLMGHFDYWPDSNLIIYRQSLLLAGGLYPSDAQVELLLVHALEVCERHYQAWQMVALTDVSAAKALQFSLFETVGNA